MCFKSIVLENARRSEKCTGRKQGRRIYRCEMINADLSLIWRKSTYASDKHRNSCDELLISEPDEKFLCYRNNEFDSRGRGIKSPYCEVANRFVPRVRQLFFSEKCETSTYDRGNQSEASGYHKGENHLWFSCCGGTGGLRRCRRYLHLPKDKDMHSFQEDCSQSWSHSDWGKSRWCYSMPSSVAGLFGDKSDDPNKERRSGLVR